MMKNSWLLIECIPLPFFPKPLPHTLQSSSAIWSYLGSLFSVEVGWLSMSYPVSGRTSIHALSNIQNAKQRRHRLPCLLQVLEHLNVLLLQRKIVSASVRAKNNRVVSSPYNLGFSFSKKEKDALFQSQLKCWSGKVKNKGKNFESIPKSHPKYPESVEIPVALERTSYGNIHPALEWIFLPRSSGSIQSFIGLKREKNPLNTGKSNDLDGRNCPVVH